MTKTVLIEIVPLSNKNTEDEQKKEISAVYKLLGDFRYQIRNVSNQIMNMQYTELYRSIQPNAQKAKDYYGHSYRTVLYHYAADKLPEFGTSNVAMLITDLISKAVFNSKDLLGGKKSLSTFTNDKMPIPLHNNSYRIFHDEKSGKYYLTVSLFSKVGKKKHNLDRVTFLLKVGKGSQKAIVDRIINGYTPELIAEKYKQGSGQLLYKKRKNKNYITVSYSFEPHKEDGLKNRILGVDLGIANVATMAVWDCDKHEYLWLDKNDLKISGDELIHYRQKEHERRRGLQVSARWASDARTGHGRKSRLKYAYQQGDKMARYRDTYNHKISRAIVEIAKKYHCNCIQMENLSGFSEAQEESLLKNWAYYDLQQKVIYKAQEVGIVVNLIDPKYTSKRCSVCGRIHEENRDCEKDQAKFECHDCGKKMNADINAARNIALPNIENLIEVELDRLYPDRKKSKKKKRKAS